MTSWTAAHQAPQFSSVAQSCPTLCNPMNHSTPGLPVHHHLPEFAQTHVHRVRDAIQPSHPRSSPSLPALNPSQHQSQSMAFPRQEHWSGLPFPSPGDLPDPGVEPTSAALAFGFLTAEKPGSPRDYLDDTLLCSTLCKAFILRKVFDSKIYKHKKSFSLGPGFLTLDKEGRFSTW